MKRVPLLKVLMGPGGIRVVEKVTIKNTEIAQRYIVCPSRLEGRVVIDGAKNSALKLLVASLLTDEQMEFTNFPVGILDAQIGLGMLGALGKQYSVRDNKVIITEPDRLGNCLCWKGRSIRTTLLILGALVARNGRGCVPLPGGCRLGERKHDIHEMVLRNMGADVWTHNETLNAESKGRLIGTDIHLPIRSTGATENAIICGALAEGQTRIWNPHIRPEIIDLINCLRKMGANIEVFGQEHISITGVDGLRGARHAVIADNLEALTWFIGTVITGGDVEIVGFPRHDLEIPLIHLRESGAVFYTGSNEVIVRGGRCYPIDISTGPYPAINSDMQPLFAVYGACAQGESRIVDLRFPGRYGYAEELNRLGAACMVEGNMLKITGGRKLVGTEVTALDLRAGVALALAGLIAQGETVIRDAWQIERGYVDFLQKLSDLGGRAVAIYN